MTVLDLKRVLDTDVKIIYFKYEEVGEYHELEEIWLKRSEVSLSDEILYLSVFDDIIEVVI